MKLPIFVTAFVSRHIAAQDCCQEVNVVVSSDNPDPLLNFEGVFDITANKDSYNGPLINGNFFVLGDDASFSGGQSDNGWSIYVYFAGMQNPINLGSSGDHSSCLSMGTFTGTFEADNVDVSTSCLDIVPEVNCYDGNNGGCSHVCSQSEQKCSCPACMVLLEDGMTCGPDPDLVSVTCSQSGMTVEMDQCVFGSNVVQIGFSEDAECQSQNAETSGETGNYVIESGLDTCGMTSSNAEENEIEFTNFLSVISRHTSNSIQIRASMNVAISCTFDVNAVTTTNAVIATAAGVSGTAGVGDFAFHAAYFTDDTFLEEVVDGDNDHGYLGEKLYLGIYPATVVEGVKFSVTTCTISDGVQSFDIIKDGCPSDSIGWAVHHANADVHVNDIFQFSYDAFKFTGTAHEEETPMDVMCYVRVCTDDCQDPVC